MRPKNVGSCLSVLFPVTVSCLASAEALFFARSRIAETFRGLAESGVARPSVNCTDSAGRKTCFCLGGARLRHPGVALSSLDESEPFPFKGVAGGRDAFFVGVYGLYTSSVASWLNPGRTRRLTIESHSLRPAFLTLFAMAGLSNSSVSGPTRVGAGRGACVNPDGSTCVPISSFGGHGCFTTSLYFRFGRSLESKYCDSSSLPTSNVNQELIEVHSTYVQQQMNPRAIPPKP